MTGGVPTWQTYENVFAIINYKELENILVDFYKSLTMNTLDKDCLNIDGRTDNGSSRKETKYNEKVKSLNVLNMYSNKYGICLTSEQIEEKTNEIPTIPDILKRTNIKDCIITWDALNTQTKNIEAVIEGNRVKDFYKKLSLKKIRKLISFDFETNFINLICYLMLK